MYLYGTFIMYDTSSCYCFTFLGETLPFCTEKKLKERVIKKELKEYSYTISHNLKKKESFFL